MVDSLTASVTFVFYAKGKVGNGLNHTYYYAVFIGSPLGLEVLCRIVKVY